MKGFIIVVLIVVTGTGAAFGQSSPPPASKPPPYTLSRWDESGAATGADEDIDFLYTALVYTL